MNPIQTEPTQKSENLAHAPEQAEEMRFAHSSQEKKRKENRRKTAKYMKDLNRRNAIGDMLYMVGFWVEYVFVRLGRGLGVFVRGVGNTVLDLIMLVLRPILIGIVTLLEDLTSPFTRILSGIRHIHQLPDKMEEENIPSRSGTPLHTFCPLWQRRHSSSSCAAASVCALC